MKIDLRYLIVLGAFFAPAGTFRLMFWLWGAEITELGFAATVSAFGGIGAAIIAAILLFDSTVSPIYFPPQRDT